MNEQPLRKKEGNQERGAEAPFSHSALEEAAILEIIANNPANPIQALEDLGRAEVNAQAALAKDEKEAFNWRDDAFNSWYAATITLAKAHQQGRGPWKLCLEGRQDILNFTAATLADKKSKGEASSYRERERLRGVYQQFREYLKPQLLALEQKHRPESNGSGSESEK